TARELVALAGSRTASVTVVAQLATGVVCIVIADQIFMPSGQTAWLLAITTVALGVAALAPALAGVEAPSPALVHRSSLLFMAPIYIGVPMGTIAAVDLLRGREALSLLLAVIVASDSAQYYAGRAFGRRKLAPAISPAKTVEGAIGGLIVAAAGGGGPAPVLARRAGRGGGGAWGGPPPPRALRGPLPSPPARRAGGQ